MNVFRNAVAKISAMIGKKKKHLKLQDSIQLTQRCFFGEVFLESEFGNRSQGNWSEDPTVETDKQLPIFVSIRKQAAEGCTSANSLTNKSLHKGSEEEVRGAKASIEHLRLIDNKYSQEERQTG
jgi:hypothetical protein